MLTDYLANYKIVGTISESPESAVYVCTCKNDEILGRLYILNILNYINKRLFAELFSCCTEKKMTGDMKNFWIENNKFCAVFKYSPGEQIDLRFSKKRNTLNLQERVELLQEILIKLDSISSLPLPILSRVTRLQNLIIDSKNKFHVLYNMSNLPTYESCKESEFYYNVSNIIQAVFQRELSKRNNELIKIIVDKCKNKLYNSIPEMIIEIKKTIPFYIKSDNLGVFKRIYQQHKRSILKTISIASMVAVVVLLCVNIYPTLGNSKNKTGTTEPFTIGKFTYNAYISTAESNVIAASALAENTEKEIEVDLSITPETEIEFEDYIVQNDDTVESICDLFYPNKNFIKTILTFNNLNEDSELISGSILRIPNPTAVNDHFYN